MPQDKPPAVAFNLDTFKREVTPEPFVVRLGRRNYTLLDPMEFELNELDNLLRVGSGGDVKEAIGTVIAEKDREAFFANRLPVFKLGALFDAYTKHYDLKPGNSPAS